jgi:hypothetical protein
MFLAAQGELDRMSRLTEVFDNQKFYVEAFRSSYLDSDARRIVLAYKVNLMLNSHMEELEEKASAKLRVAIGKARNLVWALLIQSLLNDPGLSAYLESYGSDLQRQQDFRMLLRRLASAKIPPLLRAVLAEESYQQKLDVEKYSFLRTKELFRRSMDEAYDKFAWTKKSL